MNNHNHVADHHEESQRRAGDDTKCAQNHGDGDPDGDRQTQLPGVQGAARSDVGFKRNGNQGGLGHGGGKANGGGKEIDPAIAIPRQVGARVSAGCYKGGIGQLHSHHFAQWEECLFKPDKKQRQAGNDQDKTAKHIVQPRDGFAQDHQLKKRQNDDDRHDIAHSAGKGFKKCEDCSAHGSDHHSVDENESNWKERGEGNEAKTIDHRIAAADHRR